MDMWLELITLTSDHQRLRNLWRWKQTGNLEASRFQLIPLEPWGPTEVPMDGGGLRGGDPAPHNPAVIRPLPFLPFGLCYLLDFVFLFIGMKRSHD